MDSLLAKFERRWEVTGEFQLVPTVLHRFEYRVMPLPLPKKNLWR